MEEKWAAALGGSESVRDYDRSGRPKEATEENAELVHSLVMCGRRNLRDIVRQIGIHFVVVQSLFTDILRLPMASARWAPRMLTKDQKKSRLDIFMYLLCLYEDDPEEFMCQVVTQDETGPSL